MPSPTRIFMRDPNKLGRGKGIYYYRGTYKSKKHGTIKGYYSKYNIERDAKIKAKGYKTHKVGLPVKSRIKHAGDGRLPR